MSYKKHSHRAAGHCRVNACSKQTRVNSSSSSSTHKPKYLVAVFGAVEDQEDCTETGDDGSREHRVRGEIEP